MAYEQQQLIATFDVTKGNEWLKSHAQPAADWGVAVGVSTFGLCMIVTMLIIWVKFNY
jgi:hypothetical protein